MPDPSKFTFPKLKQYVPVQDLKPKNVKETWKKGELIHIDPSEHRPYVAARLVLPLDTALREGIYNPSVSKTVGSKIKDVVIGKPEKDEAVTATETDSSKASEKDPEDTGSKKLLENKLRDAVQTKKAQNEEAALESGDKKIDQDKLAAIKSGGKK
jgi:hypothetical protein